MSNGEPSNQPGRSGAEGRSHGERLSARTWLKTGLRVGLIAGVVVGLADALIVEKGQLGLMTIGLCLWNLSFSAITHGVFAVTVCVAACLFGGAFARFLPFARRWLRPGPLAGAAFLVAEVIMLGWIVVALRRWEFPRTPAGIAATVGMWLVATMLLARLFAWLRRTWVGRGAAGLSRVLIWPAALALLMALGMQLWARPQVQTGDPNGLYATSTPTSRPRDRRPDVVFIVLDTLRVDRLGCYGYTRDTSPHIDAFAKGATVYTWAISPAPWTVPSHASMFTGLYPSQHGTKIGWLAERFVTLAEALRDQGYQTMGLSNNAIVSHVTKLDQGFEQFIEPVRLLYNKRCLGYTLVRYGMGRDGPLGSWLGRWYAYNAGGHVTAPLAARWLERRDRSRPVFLFVNYMETHGPFEPPVDYRKRFVQAEDLKRSYEIDQSRAAVWLYSLAGKPVYSSRDLKILSDLYDARVREVDDCFADLMRTLAREIDLENAVIIVTSDHGENLGEHGLFGHHALIYNELVHVPLIVRWPGMKRPARVDSLVQTNDLFPSILNWTGTPVRQTAKLLAAPLADTVGSTSRSASRYGIAERLHWPKSEAKGVQAMLPTFDPNDWNATYRAIFDRRRKLIVGTSGSLELYDLANDPGEHLNLARTEGETVGRMMRQMQQWLGSFEGFDPSRSSVTDDPALKQERLQRLRDLGYVQ